MYNFCRMFYGNDLNVKLSVTVRVIEVGSDTVFGYYIEGPKWFGIMEFEDLG